MSDLESAGQGPASEASLSGEFTDELARVVRHPRGEARRLHAVAEEGESAATPLIELGVVARWVIPVGILMVGIAFAAYFAARHWG